MPNDPEGIVVADVAVPAGVGFGDAVATAVGEVVVGAEDPDPAESGKVAGPLVVADGFGVW